MRIAKSRKRFVLGLTGGIGSGKSTVLSMFKKKGAFTLDADAIVHQLLSKNKDVLASIKRVFGSDVFSHGHELDRRALADQVFRSSNKRKKLERMLHPRVREKIFSELRCRTSRVAVVDVPLLYESGWHKQFDRVIVVTTGLRRRLKRLRNRGFATADVDRRIKTQWPLEKKVRLADFVVDNNGPRAQTKKQVDQIWEKLPIVMDGGMVWTHKNKKQPGN
jgi:dephospho-CoA kinase